MHQLHMYAHRTSGYLITFCGLDGCGKTTQITLLENYLADCGLPIILTKQPTPFVRQSSIFRNYMDQPNHNGFDYRSLSLLAASDRVQHSNQVILPELEKGNIVISDRYFYSCVANLHARGYAKDKWIYEVAESIPKPDLAFFLDVEVETAVSRVRSRPEEKKRYIDMELQYALRQAYLDLANQNGGIVLNSHNHPAETFELILQEVNRILPVHSLEQQLIYDY